MNLYLTMRLDLYRNKVVCWTVNGEAVTRVLVAGGREFWLHSIGVPERIMSPFEGQPYVCLL